jgi:hypothetical protein
MPLRVNRRFASLLSGASRYSAMHKYANAHKKLQNAIKSVFEVTEK